MKQLCDFLLLLIWESNCSELLGHIKPRKKDSKKQLLNAAKYYEETDLKLKSFLPSLAMGSAAMMEQDRKYKNECIQINNELSQPEEPEDTEEKTGQYRRNY